MRDLKAIIHRYTGSGRRENAHTRNGHDEEDKGKEDEDDENSIWRQSRGCYCCSCSIPKSSLRYSIARADCREQQSPIYGDRLPSSLSNGASRQAPQGYDSQKEGSVMCVILGQVLYIFEHDLEADMDLVGSGRQTAEGFNGFRILCESNVSSIRDGDNGIEAEPEALDEEGSSDIIGMSWIDRHQVILLARRNGWMGTASLSCLSTKEIEDNRRVRSITVTYAHLGTIPSGIIGMSFQKTCEFGIVACSDGVLMSIDKETLSPIGEVSIADVEGYASADVTGGQIAFRGDGACFVSMLALLVNPETHGRQSRNHEQVIAPPLQIDCRIWNIDQDGQITMEAKAESVEKTQLNLGRHIKRTDKDPLYEGFYCDLCVVALAWEPRGSIWAAVESSTLKNDDSINSHLRIVFRERNGLIRSHLSLPPRVKEVCSICWNETSDLLAVVTLQQAIEGTYRHLKYKVCLFTRKNYKWYIKKEIVCSSLDSGTNIRSEKPPHIQWDNVNKNTLWILSGTSCAGQTCFIRPRILSIDLEWVTHVSLNESIVGVTDDNKLMLTSFREAIIPPPMCHVTLYTNDAIIGVAIASANPYHSILANDSQESNAQVDLIAAITNIGEIIVVKKDSMLSWHEYCDRYSRPIDVCKPGSTVEECELETQIGETNGMPQFLHIDGELHPDHCMKDIHCKVMTPKVKIMNDGACDVEMEIIDPYEISEICWFDCDFLFIALLSGRINIYKLEMDACRKASVTFVQQLELPESQSSRCCIQSITQTSDLVTRPTDGVHENCKSIIVQTIGGALFEISKTNENSVEAFSLQNLRLSFPSKCTTVIALDILTSNCVHRKAIFGRCINGHVFGLQQRTQNNQSLYSVSRPLYEDTTSMTLYSTRDNNAWLVMTTSANILVMVEVNDIISNAGDSGDVTFHESFKMGDRETKSSLTKLSEGQLHEKMSFAMRGAGFNMTEYGDTTKRMVDMGALLVTGVSADSSLILQSPRGNVECIFPRCFMINNIVSNVVRDNYFYACMLCRRHRVDYNVIVDFDWPNCLHNSKAGLIVSDIIRDKISGLNDFASAFEVFNDLLNGLKNENVLDSKGIYGMIKIQPLPELDIKLDDDPQFQHLLSLPKKSAICLAFRRCLLEILGTTIFELGKSENAMRVVEELIETILLTYVNMDLTDCEGALSFIDKLTAGKVNDDSVRLADVDVNHLREFSIRKLLLIVDNSSLVCQAALATYNIELCCYCYYFSDHDPLEFLPTFEMLRNCSELERKLQIDERLEKHSKCIDWIVMLINDDENISKEDQTCKFSSDKLISKLLLIMKENNLHRYAIKVVQDRILKWVGFLENQAFFKSLLNKIVLEYGNHLNALGRYDDAALCYMEVEDYKKAQDCYQQQQDWKMCLYVAFHHNNLNLKQQHQIASSIADDLLEIGGEENKREVSLIYLHVLKDIDRCVSILCSMQEWQECLQVITTHNRSDLISTMIAPAAAVTASAIIEKCKDSSERIAKYMARLETIIQSKENLRAALDDAETSFHTLSRRQDELDDNVSELSAYTNGTSLSESSRSSSVFSKGLSTAASARQAKKRNKKKEKRERNKLKAGGENEDVSLKKLIIQEFDVSVILSSSTKKVGMLCELLVILRHLEDAQVLQREVDRYCVYHSEVCQRIRKLNIQDENYNSSIGYEEHATEKRVQLDELMSSTREPWKWALLRDK